MPANRANGHTKDGRFPETPTEHPNKGANLRVGDGWLINGRRRRSQWEEEEKQERRRRRGRRRRRDGSRVIMGEHEGEDEGCGRKGREGERGG